MTYTEEKKLVELYHEGREKYFSLWVPKGIREKNFKDFARKVTEHMEKHGRMKGKKAGQTAAGRAAAITGVRIETARKYLRILKENDYIDYSSAKVEEVVPPESFSGSTDIRPRKSPRPPWLKMLPRSAYGPLPRLSSGKLLPRVEDLCEGEQKIVVGTSSCRKAEPESGERSSSDASGEELEEGVGG